MAVNLTEKRRGEMKNFYVLLMGIIFSIASVIFEERYGVGALCFMIGYVGYEIVGRLDEIKEFIEKK